MVPGRSLAVTVQPERNTDVASQAQKWLDMSYDSMSALKRNSVDVLFGCSTNMRGTSRDALCMLSGPFTVTRLVQSALICARSHVFFATRAGHARCRHDEHDRSSILAIDDAAVAGWLVFRGVRASRSQRSVSGIHVVQSAAVWTICTCRHLTSILVQTSRASQIKSSASVWRTYQYH